MEEISIMAKRLGFKAKTLTTSHTLLSHVGTKSKMLINDTCELLLLHEIQAWLRKEHKIYVFCTYWENDMWFSNVHLEDSEIVDEVLMGDFEENLRYSVLKGLEYLQKKV